MTRRRSFLGEPAAGPADRTTRNGPIVGADGVVNAGVIEDLFDDPAGVSGPLCASILHTWSRESEALLRSSPLMGLGDERLVDRECR
jgi:hypothetical protein